MKKTGMTLIVKNVAKLVTAFIAVFGIYIALTGHLAPGGGFAGGVILAAAAILMVLAFGGAASKKLITEGKCHNWDAAAALAFLAVALGGFLVGGFFQNFITPPGGPPPAELGKFVSGGTMVLSNLAILVKVGAGMAGVFLALSAFRPSRSKE